MTTPAADPAQPRPPALPADRYGRPSRLGRRTRTALLAALGAVAVGLATWIALGSASAPVTWQEVGFRLGDDVVEVVFDVTRPDPTVAVRCTVEALDAAHAQVGYHDVDVPPSEHRTVRQTLLVHTVGPAVTGVVDACAPL